VFVVVVVVVVVGGGGVVVVCIDAGTLLTCVGMTPIRALCGWTLGLNNNNNNKFYWAAAENKTT